MTEPRARPAGVFRARVDRLDGAFRASCGVLSAPTGARAAADPPEAGAVDTGALNTGAFASYDDARAFVHLSAGQAGFRAIAWDADSCAAPQDVAAG